MMLSLDARYRHDPNVVDREVAGEVILVPIHQNVGDLESIYTLNETAAEIWALLDGERTLAQVRDAIVDEYEVEAEEVEADLIALMTKLVDAGVVQQRG